MTTKMELDKRGFRRIKACRFPYTCMRCGERLPKDSILYWKKIEEPEGATRMVTICQDCFKKG